jgi:hypothetical protein
VKDWFSAKDLARSVEGEVEASEVSERTPASPDDGPVEQFEAIGLWDRLQAGGRIVGTRVNKRVTAAGFGDLEVGERGSDCRKGRVGSGSVMAASLPVPLLPR